MTTEPEKPGEDHHKKSINAYAKYSTMAFQMIVPIVLGVWGGRKLDEYFETKFPAFTLSLSLLSVFARHWALSMQSLRT